MPIWKFAGGTTTVEELTDARLDLSAYGQVLEDLSSWLLAHDGLEFSDLVTSLATIGYSLTDLVMYLEAQSGFTEDMQSWLATLAENRADLATLLYAMGYGTADPPISLQAARWLVMDLSCSLEAVTSTILCDLYMDLVATDGAVLLDAGLYLAAVHAAPTFYSTTAQRIAAVITEVN
jgi:hypothetical protein